MDYLNRFCKLKGYEIYFMSPVKNIFSIFAFFIKIICLIQKKVLHLHLKRPVFYLPKFSHQYPKVENLTARWGFFYFTRLFYALDLLL